MLPLDEAVERILSKVAPLGAESVPACRVLHRIAAEDICSPIHLPPFDNSAMDGYAVLAADTANAGGSAPVKLRCRGELPAGSQGGIKLNPGECLRIFTGSVLPDGADAVVMQEDTHRNDSDPGMVEVFESAKPWENVRFAGEDIKKGQVIVRAGERIRPGQLALISACGFCSLNVGTPPSVALLATGSELVEPGSARAAGQIYESNRLTLASLIENAGARPVMYPVVGDSLDETVAALQTAASNCDVLVTTGAVSVGDHDLVKPAIGSLGGVLDFWRVSIRPGKPFVFGELDGKLFFGLPGNPVSAFVTFLLLVRPALLKLQGARELALPVIRGQLAETFRNTGNRPHFARVVLRPDGLVVSAGLQASHAMSSLALANGLLEVPAQGALETGSEVKVMLING